MPLLLAVLLLSLPCPQVQLSLPLLVRMLQLLLLSYGFLQTLPVKLIFILLLGLLLVLLDLTNHAGENQLSVEDDHASLLEVFCASDDYGLISLDLLQ